MIKRLGRELLLLTQGHLTGVLAVVRSGDGKFMFAKHRYRKVPWGLPGGIMNRLEEPKDALLREMNEEFCWSTEGQQWKLLEVAASKSFPQIEICYFFEAPVDPGIFKPADFSNEILELAWVFPGEAQQAFKLLERHRKLALVAAERYGLI